MSETIESTSTPAPRSLEAIQQAYNQTCGQLGDLDYRFYLAQKNWNSQHEAFSTAIAKLKASLEAINEEGTKANELAKKSHEPTAEVTQ